MKNQRKPLIRSLGWFAAFVLWTAAVSHVDVQTIGPLDSGVGFARINRFVHDLTGVHVTLYTITDWLGLVPVGVCMGFALLGLIQWVRRKSLRKVDRSILALGGCYIVVIAAYLFFEKVVINYRPVLIDGVLEASYPSTTTMLVLCVMLTAWMQLKDRMKNRRGRFAAGVLIFAFAGFMVIGRLLSGVHWATDIVGGILLSGGIVCLYDFAAHLKA